MLGSMTRASDDKVLILFRHAKAEEGLGKADPSACSPAAGCATPGPPGAWLHEHELGPELVLCSTAPRTRQTWDAAVEGGACGEAVEYVEDVYSGGAETRAAGRSASRPARPRSSWSSATTRRWRCSPAG